MMKKIFASLLSLCCLCGCSGAQLSVNELKYVNMAETMDAYIAKSVLKNEERAELESVKGNRVISVWDYQIDDSIKTIAFNIQTLNDQGEWEAVNIATVSTETAKEMKKGRMAILLDDLDKEQEIVFLNGENAEGEVNAAWRTSIDSTYFTEASFEDGVHGYTVNDVLSMEQAADQSIPLILLFGSKNCESLASPNVSIFEDLDALAQKDYDYCYILTIEFSSLPMDDYQV